MFYERDKMHNTFLRDQQILCKAHEKQCMPGNMDGKNYKVNFTLQFTLNITGQHTAPCVQIWKLNLSLNTLCFLALDVYKFKRGNKLFPVYVFNAVFWMFRLYWKTPSEIC